MRAPHRVARSLVRTAAAIAPENCRDRVVREWEAELARAFQLGGGWEVTWSAAGAFADAISLRRMAIPTGQLGRLGAWLAGVAWDARVAMRGLRRTPSFSIISVLTLGIGLGGVVAIYTVVDRVVLDPLPYPDAERLVRLENRVPGVSPDEVWMLSTAQWVLYTERSQTLDEVGLYLGQQAGTMPGGNIMTPPGAYRASGSAVTASTVRLLGVRPHLGRLIDDRDDQPDVPLVVLLTYEFWRDVLGSDPDVIGRDLYTQQQSEIIGVLEPGAHLPGWPPGIELDLWFPMQTDRNGSFGNNHVFPAIARLAPGASVEEVQAELDALQDELPERFPQAYGQTFFDRFGFRAVVGPLKDDVVGTLARDLWILLGGVALVLVIACANVVGLFAVRTEARARELRVRAALGAGRATLARYSLVEGTLLALLGGVLAVGVSHSAIPVLTALAPDGLPRMENVRVGPDAVALTALLSLMIGVGLALHSMIAGRTPRGGPGLPTVGRASSSGPGPQRMRSLLVVGQVALAVTLTVGAGLLVQGIRDLRDADVGFRPAGVLAVDLYPDYSRYRDDTRAWDLVRTLLDRVKALPGVVTAGLGEELPVTGRYGCTAQGFEDEAVYERLREAGLTTCAGQERVTPGYFEALGIPVLEGREFERGDIDEPTRASVIVSRAFADRFWPGESAIGRGVAPYGRNDPPFYHVVGVVGDVPRAAEAGERPFAEDAIAIYYPVVDNPDVDGNWGSWWLGEATLLVRVAGADPMTLFSSIRAIVDELDREMPLANARSMEGVVLDALASISFLSLLFGIAAAVALTLAAVGLYGVISYVVTCRTKEIGLRMAVGARRDQLERMVIGRTIRLVGLGMLVGVPLALGAVRMAQALLVGVDVMEPTAYVAAAGVMAVVALAAGWVPARRAAGVDPMAALRGD